MKKQTERSRKTAVKKLLKGLKITFGTDQTPVEALGGEGEKLKDGTSALVSAAAVLTLEKFTAFLEQTLGAKFEAQGITGDWAQIATDFKAVVEQRIKETIEAEAKKRLPGDYPLSTQVIKQTLNPFPSESKPSFSCRDEHKLTAAHFKLEHAFLSLLEQTSADKNPESDGFFTGNMGAEILNVGDERGQQLALQQAQTRVQPKDIYRAYYGKNKVSGAERKNVWRAIEEYRNLNFTWVLEAAMPDGRVFRADIKRPRINVDLVSLSDRETTDKIEAGDEKSREAEQWLVLTFHAAFLAFKYDGGKYSKTPKNLNAILEAAAGGAKKVTAAHYRLFHYLNSLRSTRKGEGVFQTEIERAGLIEKLALSHHWESRNGAKGEAALSKVVADIQKTGLVQSLEERAGKNGKVFCFSVNLAPVWISAKRG